MHKPSAAETDFIHHNWWF